MNPFDTAWNLLKELSDEDLEYAAQFGGLRDPVGRYKGVTEEPKVSIEELLDRMRAHGSSKPDEHGRKPATGVPTADLVGKPVEWPGDKGPPVTMGALDHQGRHKMPKKVSTEQNIAQLLGGGPSDVELPEESATGNPDEFTVDAPKASPKGKGNPVQNYWESLFDTPVYGADEGEGGEWDIISSAPRAELEQGEFDEGEEADPDAHDSTFDTYHQEAPEPTLPSGESYREGHPMHGDEEPDALWPGEVHAGREAQEHEREMDAMHAAMTAINPDHRSPSGHIPGEGTHGVEPDMVDRAVNRPEPLEEAMATLQGQHDPATQPEGTTTLGDLEQGEPRMHGEPFHPDLEQFLPEQEEPEESFDEDPMEQAMSTLEPERNVQAQPRFNLRGPAPAPGSPNYEQNMAAWRKANAPPSRRRKGQRKGRR